MLQRQKIKEHNCYHKRYVKNVKLECGPMPNVMAALSNRPIGGALCSTPQRLADAHYCSAVQ